MFAFEFDHYSDCLRAWIAAAPRQGYGQASKLARQLAVSPVFITHVLKGERDFNLDQALEAAGFMSLSEQETEYFLLLVQERRAATPKLKSRIKKQRLKIKAEARSLRVRLPVDHELTPDAKAVFYGHWHYSAVRLLTSIADFQTTAAIAAKLQMSMERAEGILNFLERQRLVVKNKNRWVMGPQRTHLEAGSPFIVARQVQWRTKGFEAMASGDERDLFYTGTMSLDQAAFDEIREVLSRAIQRSLDKVKAAPSERIACLNVDWFRFG